MGILFLVALVALCGKRKTIHRNRQIEKYQRFSDFPKEAQAFLLRARRSESKCAWMGIAKTRRSLVAVVMHVGKSASSQVSSTSHTRHQLGHNVQQTRTTAVFPSPAPISRSGWTMPGLFLRVASCTKAEPKGKLAQAVSKKVAGSASTGTSR